MINIPNWVDASLSFAVDQVGKTEVPGNNGFNDPFLDMVMKRVGHQHGWAWCSLFAEACWSHPTYSGKSKVIAGISDNFSANAVKTYENFQSDRSGYFQVDQSPQVGDVVIWKKMRGGDSVKTGIWTLGHAGVVYKVNKNGFAAIEGNTNAAGGREGIEVAVKEGSSRHQLPLIPIQDGLTVLGFIRMTI